MPPLISTSCTASYLGGEVSYLTLQVAGHDLFFFSSRRRHTRFDCDWSSDVCSSDLLGGGGPRSHFRERRADDAGGARQRGDLRRVLDQDGAHRVVAGQRLRTDASGKRDRESVV